MITDALLRLSGTQGPPAVPQDLGAMATGAFTYSTYYLDLQGSTNASGGTTTSQIRDIGEGEDLYAFVTVETSIAQATGGTVVFECIVSDAFAGTGNPLVIGSVVVPWVTGNPNLVAGSTFAIRINPQLGTVGQRYLQMRYSATTTGTTAGKVFADITTDIYDSKKFYASGFKVS